MPSLSTRPALYTFAALATLVEMGCSASQRVYPDDDAGVGGGTATGGTHTAPGKTTAVGGSSVGASSGGANLGGSGGDGASSTVGADTSGAATSVGGITSTGGASATGGASTSLGGASTGVASTNGGASTTGGATATVGGKTSVGGTSANIGGASATGGAPVTGGASATGGASGCTKDADCINSDPINCSYSCVNPGTSGTCKPSATLTPTQCATAACEDRAISGYWDASGKPHIAYAFTETDGSATIRMQQVKADGTVEGALAAFKLETNQLAPKMLSANAIGSKVGLLYETTVPNTQGPSFDYAEFAITDVNGAVATATNLSTEGNASRLVWSRLDVTPLGSWLGLGMLHDPGGNFWLTTAGSNLAPWTKPQPQLFENQFAASVVDNTLMLTGSSCNPLGSCTPTFDLQRYSATSLASIGSTITLSQKFQDPVQTPPVAMGTVSGQVALLWTELESPGQLYRTLIKADGTFAHPVESVQSAISPRAILQSPGGGSLLVGVITTGASYQLVGQRLDSNLGLIGNPLPIAAAQSTDVTNIEVHSSADGSKVLVTYRQAGARYRALGTNLCGG